MEKGSGFQIIHIQGAYFSEFWILLQGLSYQAKTSWKVQGWIPSNVVAIFSFWEIKIHFLSPVSTFVHNWITWAQINLELAAKNWIWRVWGQVEDDISSFLRLKLTHSYKSPNYLINEWFSNLLNRLQVQCVYLDINTNRKYLKRGCIRIKTLILNFWHDRTIVDGNHTITAV